MERNVHCGVHFDGHADILVRVPVSGASSYLNRYRVSQLVWPDYTSAARRRLPNDRPGARPFEP
jgi:hypothetical protein